LLLSHWAAGCEGVGSAPLLFRFTHLHAFGSPAAAPQCSGADPSTARKKGQSASPLHAARSQDGGLQRVGAVCEKKIAGCSMGVYTVQLKTPKS
jgi:hypothetical protein